MKNGLLTKENMHLCYDWKRVPIKIFCDSQKADTTEEGEFSTRKLQAQRRGESFGSRALLLGGEGLRIAVALGSGGLDRTG